MQIVCTFPPHQRGSNSNGHQHVALVRQDLLFRHTPLALAVSSVILVFDSQGCRHKKDIFVGSLLKVYPFILYEKEHDYPGLLMDC